MDKLSELLKEEGRRLSSEFGLASAQGEGTSQEIADFREHALQDFIARFLPQDHVVSKGKFIDLDGKQSPSIDCLVLNPAHPNLIDSRGKFRLIFADACDAAIEVKPDLARTDELQRAITQCQSAKQIRRSRSAFLIPEKHPQHMVVHACHVPFYVFALKSFQPAKLYASLIAHYSTNETPLEEQLDAIFINDVGVVKHVKHAELNYYDRPPPIGKSTGWYFEDWGDATLMGMLLSLEYSFHSQPHMSENILKRILTRASKFNVCRLGDPVAMDESPL